MPSELPILFSAPMIRANRAGRKTMTRRLLALPKWSTGSWDDFELDKHGKPHAIASETGCQAEIPSPYGEPGDTLYVREAYALPAEYDGLKPLDIDRDTFLAKIHFMADGIQPYGYGKTRPSLFLPAWASRSRYLVTAIRCEELNDISERDAVAEGIELIGRAGQRFHWKSYGAPGYYQDPRQSYRSLWESLHGAGSWGGQWVWVVEYSNPEAKNGTRKTA